MKRRVGGLAGAAACGVMAAVIALASAPAAGAARSPAQPLPVQTASLVQDGQLLVWQVQLRQPFSPGELARDRRALCLIFERPPSDAVTGELCVTGPARHSSRPRIVYMRIKGSRTGPTRPVAARVTRTSSRELTASFLPSAAGLTYHDLRWQVVSSLRRAACAPRSPTRGVCLSVYPAKPALLKLHLPRVIGCVPKGPSLVYQGPSKGREIALTFDDGPWDDPPTLDFLHVLEKEQVPATFFEIGRQIPVYDPAGAPETQMLIDGDMIGDHTWSHPDMAKLRPAAQRSQLLHTIDAVRRATGGFTPCLWRPPYGDVSPSLVKVARSLGMLTVMWDIDPRDWSRPGVAAIVSNVERNAHPGAIVLQHFGGGPREQTLEALPREIEDLRSRGYRFVTVAQMLGLKLLYR